MLALLLNHSPAFLTGELMLGYLFACSAWPCQHGARKIFNSSSGSGDQDRVAR